MAGSWAGYAVIAPTSRSVSDCYFCKVTTVIGFGMDDKTGKAMIVFLAVGAVGIFLKSAWDDAKNQAKEAANLRPRWTDKNRWE